MATEIKVPVVAAKGGSFLIEERTPDEIFTPEDFSEEQVMIGQTADDFMVKELVPRLPDLLKLDYELSRGLLRKAGELGLLGVEIPEEYGGLGLDKVSGCLVAEKAGRDGSFATTFAVQVGIGTLPIVFFGTEAQKKKYLPKLASGEWVSSYSLSEASSASDAMNAKARAVLSPDGKSWILNGEKMWLSNAGFADIYITFAKVDGEHFTAFIVEKGMPGVSLGAEEKKTGIKGSSTRPLILTDAVIPKENLLGDIGKGHKIAFNILNVGRFKLGAMVTGGTKLTVGVAAAYGNSRTAFGQPITSFGLIKHKIGQMAILTYVSESMVYRTAGMIDRNLADVGLDDSETALRRIEEYDVECSMVKVWCSEMCDYVVDENLQIFGGAGFVEDYPAERYWRDARVNRIYEGTSEINRLLVPGRLIRRALKGELPIFKKAMALLDELTSGPSREAPAEGFLAAEAAMLAGAKKVALMCLGTAVQKRGEALKDEQEVLGHFADIAMATYALESALLRTRKRAAARGEEATRLQEAAVRCYAQDAMDEIEASARKILAAVEEGDTLRTLLAAVKRFTKREVCNTVALRRLVADAAIEQVGYPLG
ncbi:MAG TPA: acyl-CoA dehydrogenase family protein [Vicinamibacteria bacterium]|nr:acyl-CoA dehydrogenase family protein [Vicinamibacteria bacterium]